jgi:hypothetical protein
MEKFRVLITHILDQFEHIRFDKTHAWHRDMVCLYCSIIEHGDSLYKLFEQERITAAPLLLRSMLEAFIDLKNLSNDQSYGYYLQSSNLKEWLKVTKAAGTLQNPYLDGLASAEGFDEQVSNWEKELEDYRKEGYSPLNQFQKFEKAGMVNEYRSLYNFLCSYSHNNIRALTDRHLELTDDKTDFKVVMFQEFDAEKSEHYLQTATTCLNQSSKLIHKALKTGKHNEFENT